MFPYPCYGGNGIRGYVNSYNRRGHFPLIGRQGALCGNINEVSGDFYATEHCVVVNTFAGVDVNWVIFLLKAMNLNQYATATAQPGLSVATVNDVQFCLPPYKEQKRIATTLNMYSKLIDCIDEESVSLSNAINITKSKILDLAISGKLVSQDPADEPAIELLKRINPNFKPCDNSHYPFEIPDSWIFASGKDIFLPMKSTKPSGDEFFYIDIDSVDNKNNVIHSPKRVKTENAPSRASRLTKKGDVVFSMVRPYLRNIAAVRENGCIASTGFFVCSPNKSIHTDYMFLMMLSSYVIDGLNQFMKGDNSPSINTDNILSWKYPVPPLNEQRRIVVEVQRLYQCLEQIETHLTK